MRITQVLSGQSQHEYINLLFPAMGKFHSSHMPQGCRLKILILKPSWLLFFFWLFGDKEEIGSHQLLDSSHTNFSRLRGAWLLWDIAESSFPAEYKRRACLMGELLLSQNPVPQGQAIMRQISVWRSTKKRKKRENSKHWAGSIRVQGCPEVIFCKMTLTVAH